MLRSACGNHNVAGTSAPFLSCFTEGFAASDPFGTGIVSVRVLKKMPALTAEPLDHAQLRKPSLDMTITALSLVYSSHLRVAAVNDTP